MSDTLSEKRQGRSGAPDTAASEVWAYHFMSSHSSEAYAPGPTQVNWNTQPRPYRRFDGAPVQSLPTKLANTDASYADLFQTREIGPEPVSLSSLAQLLALSFGISGWKSFGTEKWAVRCNPSSGNLHPTEAYILVGGVQELQDGLYHYNVEEHALEHRCQMAVSTPGVWIGLSSIGARETWKYGIRAFRYCQLDIGHAMGAVCFAAATMGWAVTPVSAGESQLAELLGTSRPEFDGTGEAEDPEILLQIDVHRQGLGHWPSASPCHWNGRPSQCSDVPMASWVEIDRVRAASAGLSPRVKGRKPVSGNERALSEANAVEVIRTRRSARRFTSKSPPEWHILCDVLRAVHLQKGPLEPLETDARIETLVAIHKVAGLAPGLYALPRTNGWERLSRDLSRVSEVAPTVESKTGLVKLTAGDHRAVLRKFACHQGVASEGAAIVVMFADLDRELGRHPSQYRHLHREAGVLGQALYLEATANQLGATGIGCFLDRELRSLFLDQNAGWWPIYAVALGHVHPDANAALGTG